MAALDPSNPPDTAEQALTEATDAPGDILTETPARVPEKADRYIPFSDTYRPYIPTNGLKAPSEWGKPSYILEGARRYPGIAPGPYMPQMRDVRQLNQRNAGFFIKNGSVPSSTYAGQMLLHNDK